MRTTPLYRKLRFKLAFKKLIEYLTSKWFLVALLGFATCQITRIVLQTKRYDGINVFDTWVLSLNIYYGKNYGINFGLMALHDRDHQTLLGVATACITIAFSYYLYKVSKRKIDYLISSLFLAGGLSNSFERFMQGYVFDYINTPVAKLENLFSYNLADIMIFSMIFLIFKMS